MGTTRIVTLGVCLALVACGNHRPQNQVDAAGSAATDATADDGSCTDAAKRLYVIDEHNQVATFDPATKAFHSLGLLSCPAKAMAVPFSMAVTRDATGYVLYSSGELFQVALAGNLGCTKTSWSSPYMLQQFGMGYSTDMPNGHSDSLFIASAEDTNTPMSALAKIDTATMQAQLIGGAPGWLELTGTANAQLWGFSPEGTPTVYQIDKTSGAALTTYPLPSLVGLPTAWAFAFWGGDFWVFYLRGVEPETTVYQIDGTNGTIKGHTPATGLTIVGAGVSTCAPLVVQ